MEADPLRDTVMAAKVGRVVNQRLPGLDALRIGLILLGIPYHAALPFASDALGLIRAGETSDAIAVLVVVLRTLRMPTFFLVSGFFAARLLRDRPADVWLKDRFVRLILPMIAGMATINVVQQLITETYRARVDIWIGRPLPILYHLWFLAILFALSIAVVLVRRPLDRLIDAIADRLSTITDRSRRELLFAALVAAAVLWELAVEYGFDAAIPPNLRMIESLRRAAIYAPFFVFGYGLGRIRGAMSWFSMISPTALVAAAALLLADIAVARTPNHELGSPLHLAAWTAASCYMARVATMVAARLFFAASPFVHRLADWSLPIYVLHHPWTLAAALLLQPTHWSAVVQFVIVMVLTLAATWASCVVVARSRILAILVNGRPLPPLPAWPLPIAIGRDLRNRHHRHRALRHSLPLE